MRRHDDIELISRWLAGNRALYAGLKYQRAKKCEETHNVVASLRRLVVLPRSGPVDKSAA